MKVVVSLNVIQVIFVICIIKNLAWADCLRLEQENNRLKAQLEDIEDSCAMLLENIDNCTRELMDCKRGIIAPLKTDEKTLIVKDIEAMLDAIDRVNFLYKLSEDELRELSNIIRKFQELMQLKKIGR